MNECTTNHTGRTRCDSNRHTPTAAYGAGQPHTRVRQHRRMPGHHPGHLHRQTIGGVPEKVDTAEEPEERVPGPLAATAASQGITSGDLSLLWMHLPLPHRHDHRRCSQRSAVMMRRVAGRRSWLRIWAMPAFQMPSL